MKRLAFYDFAASPVSYDFATFLSIARAHDCDHVVFVRGERRINKFKNCPDAARARFHAILAPLAGDHTLCDRDTARKLWTPDCYPDGYTLDNPVSRHSLQYATVPCDFMPFAPEKTALDYVRTQVRHPVVLTIRQTAIKPLRNSNLAAWQALGEWLVEQGEDVVVVPDTENPDLHIDGCRTFREAAFDVQIRLALYSVARLNMGVTNGPMILPFLSGWPLLYCKPINENYNETSSRTWAENFRVPRGTQPLFFNARQRIVWEDDTFEVLHDAYLGTMEESRAWRTA